MLHPVFSLESTRIKRSDVGGISHQVELWLDLVMFVVWPSDILACRADWAYHQIPKIEKVFP